MNIARSEIVIISLAAAFSIVFVLPILSGKVHTCPVLRERDSKGALVAQAVPAYARKYNVDCTYCHTAWPQLNRTGLIFRYLGYRMPYEVPSATGAAKASNPTVPTQSSIGGTKQLNAPASEDTIAAGRKLAGEMACMTCHIDGGNIVNPNKPIKGPGFQRKYPGDAQIAAVIRRGVAGTAMPAYGAERLSDKQLDQVVAFVRSLTP